ncbi:MAG: hypothetical protein AAF449_04750, partial [Myxococcota bacterium]
AAFVKGYLSEFEYRFPPLVMSKQGLMFTGYFPQENFLSSYLYTSFSNWIGMEDYFFNKDDIRLMPFEQRKHFAGEWHDIQMEMFLDCLREMMRLEK